MSSTVTCQSGNASSNSSMSVFMAARLLTARIRSRKIYEILVKDLIEFVQPAGVGGVMIAVKQFERLLIVHVPFLQCFSSDIGTPTPITRPRSIAPRGRSDDAGNRRGRRAARHDHIIAGRGGHASLREQKLIGSLRMRDGLVRAKQTVRACHRCKRGGRSGSCPFACGRPPTSPGGVGQLRYEDIC